MKGSTILTRKGTMKIYTGTGDRGKTSLFSGERVFKSHLRIEAYGDLDELNSISDFNVVPAPYVHWNNHLTFGKNLHFFCVFDFYFLGILMFSKRF